MRHNTENDYRKKENRVSRKSVQYLELDKGNDYVTEACFPDFTGKDLPGKLYQKVFRIIELIYTRKQKGLALCYIIKVIIFFISIIFP